MAKSVKVVLMIILGLGIFAGGYFWGVNVRDKEPPAASGTMNAGGMEGMAGMGGVPGKRPPPGVGGRQNKKMLGIKNSPAEKRNPARTNPPRGNDTSAGTAA